MGHPNQQIFLRGALKAEVSKVLEIGSRDYGNTEDFRSMFACEYVGLDMQDGPGVDVVQDLVQGIGTLPTDFDLIICCSVLEHVSKPWVMADNLVRLLRPGGCLYLAVPWVWRYHKYPDDYWRFSISSFELLFPGIEWTVKAYSSLKNGEFFHAQDGVDNALSQMADGRKYLPYLEIHGLGRKPV